MFAANAKAQSPEARNRERTGMSQGPLIGFEPGDWVHLPDRPDWGVGQIQSIIGARVTVNFENAGKQMILGDRVALERAKPRRSKPAQ